MLLSARPKTTHTDPNQQSRNRRKGKEYFNESHPQCHQCKGLQQILGSAEALPILCVGDFCE